MPVANSDEGPAAQPGGVASPLPSPPKQLQTLAGLTGLLDQARRKFGDTMGLRLVV
jgi:hypothetical protein